MQLGARRRDSPWTRLRVQQPRVPRRVGDTETYALFVTWLKGAFVSEQKLVTRVGTLAW